MAGHSQHQDDNPIKTSEQQHSWERRTERWLWNSRFLVMLAVVPSLLGSLILFIVAVDIRFATPLDAIYLALSVLALAAALYLMSLGHKDE